MNSTPFFNVLLDGESVGLSQFYNLENRPDVLYLERMVLPDRPLLSQFKRATLLEALLYGQKRNIEVSFRLFLSPQDTDYWQDTRKDDSGKSNVYEVLKAVAPSCTNLVQCDAINWYFQFSARR